MKISDINNDGWYYYPDSNDNYESLMYINSQGVQEFSVSDLKRWNKLGIYNNKMNIKDSLNRDTDFYIATNDNFRHFIKLSFNRNVE